MPYAVIVGSKIIGTVKRKTRSNVDAVLAKDYRRKNNVRISKIAKKRKR